MMNTLPFDTWLRRNRELLLVREIQCKDCDGSGETECRCCGSVIDCDSCGGTGKIKTDDGQLIVDEVAAKKAYDAQVKRDKELAAAWGILKA